MKEENDDTYEKCHICHKSIDEYDTCHIEDIIGHEHCFYNAISKYISSKKKKKKRQ
jgi:hypothetical protein